MKPQGRTRRVGIRDIAAHCRVSICTVSKILNRKDEGIYPPATVERVRQAASELGYRADLVARALVEGRTGVVGLCVADIGISFFGSFASRFEQRMDERRSSTFICDSREDPELEARCVATLLARRVEALVISPIDGRIAPALRAAAADGCRVVVFDRDAGECGAPLVLADNRRAMADLAARCLALGHRRIGVIRGRSGDTSIDERLHGVRDALAAVGCGEDALVLFEGPTTREAGRHGLERLLADARQPTLVLTLAGELTMGALEACHRLGIQPGRDLSLAGFDEFQAASLIPPGITVVANPVEEMADACAGLVEGASTGRLVLPSPIIWRGSVLPPRR